MNRQRASHSRNGGRVRRALGLGLAVGVAACGDSGDDDGAIGIADESEDPADGDTGIGDDADGAGSPGAGDVTAVVVIGGDTYEFEPEIGGSARSTRTASSRPRSRR